MAPPAKAEKSDVTLKVYKQTLEIRRLVDEYDTTSTGAKVRVLNDALAETRKLIKYLTSRVDAETAALGGTPNISDV